jgi:hypothetical protein
LCVSNSAGPLGACQHRMTGRLSRLASTAPSRARLPSPIRSRAADWRDESWAATHCDL